MNNTSSEALAKIQQSTAKVLALAALICVPIVVLLDYFNPASSPLVGLISGGFAMLAWLGHKKGDDFGHQMIAVGLVAQPMAFVETFAETGWQIDMHFAFLVALAALVGLVNIKAILVATLAIVLHHLGLGVFLPQFVFPSTGLSENITRALFHGVMVVLLDIGLIFALFHLRRLDRDSLANLETARMQTDEATKAQEQAETLRLEALEVAKNADAQRQETEKVLAELKEIEAEKKRSDEKARLVEEEAAREQQKKAEEQKAVVQALQNGLSRLAASDLSSKIDAPFPPEYEVLRDDYNKAVDQLSATMGRVMSLSDTLKGEVGGISESAKDLAVRTEKQVASLENSVSDLNALSGSVSQSANDAHETARTAKNMLQDAQTGGEVVKRTVKAMSEIEESSQEIAKINALIDGIAFQTNLLALNAGVEAARAGEAGRGFSVVASEVRALAQRATEAASQIGQLVEKSQSQVQVGVDLVAEAGDTLGAMLRDISVITQSVENISVASKKQSDGLVHITSEINSLDSVSQQNAAMFEETSAACTALDAGMDEMSDAVADFSLAPSDGKDDEQDLALSA